MNAYILTGGDSRRFIIDKSLAKINNQTLTELVHRNLKPLFDDILIVGKSNDFPDFKFVKDSHNVQCPLNGIVTALEHSNTDWVFIIACDLPLIKSDTIKNILNQIDNNSQLVLPIVKDRPQPLCALYNQSVYEQFKTGIDSEDYSLISKFKNLSVKEVLIHDKEIKQFLNVNYPEDLEKVSNLI